MAVAATLAKSSSTGEVVMEMMVTTMIIFSTMGKKGMAMVTTDSSEKCFHSCMIVCLFLLFWKNGSEVFLTCQSF